MASIKEILLGVNSLDKGMFIKLLKCYKLKANNENTEYQKIFDINFKLFSNQIRRQLKEKKGTENVFRIKIIENFAFVYDAFIGLKYVPT